MKWNIVFSHELPVFHILRVLPPFLPLLGVLGSDADVANRGVEPDIEDLALVTVQRHRCPPFQVSRDAARLETSFEPRLGDDTGVVCPLLGGFVEPSVQIFLNLWQINK